MIRAYRRIHGLSERFQVSTDSMEYTIKSLKTMENFSEKTYILILPYTPHSKNLLINMSTMSSSRAPLKNEQKPKYMTSEGGFL